jgi:cytochrome c oxidase subunit 2
MRGDGLMCMGQIEMKLKQGMGLLTVVAVLALVSLFSGFGAFGQDLKVEGAPIPGAIGLQAPATELAEGIRHLHNDILMWIITPITLFVLGLLLTCIIRFREKVNPVPSKTTHNTFLEVAWTVVPALILVFIALFSFPQLYRQLEIPTPDMTIRAIGHQWYWSYEYPDNGNFTFDANLIEKADIKPGQNYLLDTDNPVVLPVDTVIRIQITATDVIHSWAVPSFGVKHDAVPGRVNESWFKIERPGIFYGQCSELCGVKHGYMPITIHAVSKEQFQAWLTEAQTKFAKVDGAPPTTALAAAQ